MSTNWRFTILFSALLIAFAPTFSSAQTGDGSDGATLEDYEEESLPEHTYFKFLGVDLGLAAPTGSSTFFNSPTGPQGPYSSPRSYSDWYREGYLANVYTGIITEDGFEASISFHMTKINYTNEATAIIQTDLDQLSEFGSSVSSYIFSTQLYIGQRMKPIWRRQESIYAGAALELGTLTHESSRVNFRNEPTYALSLIGGYEIPISRSGESFDMFTMRIQSEFVAIASDERPRFFYLSFGIRQYF